MCPQRWIAGTSPGLTLPVKFPLDFRSRHWRAGQSASHREQRRFFVGAPPRQKGEIIHHLPEGRLRQAVEFLDNRFFQRVHMFIPYHVVAPWETRKCKPKTGPKRNSGVADFSRHGRFPLRRNGYGGRGGEGGFVGGESGLGAADKMLTCSELTRS